MHLYGCSKTGCVRLRLSDVRSRSAHEQDMAIGGICLRDNRTVGDKGSVSRVVQMTKECAEGLAGMDAEKSADYGPQSGRSTGSDWHELAERRLARLVDAEHDASVSRDRLELLQAESREFLVLSVTRLHRIN